MASALNRATQSGTAISFKVRVSAWLIRILSRILWRTCRVTVHGNIDHITRLLRSGQPCLPCVWHQMLLFCGHYLIRLSKSKDFKLSFLISPSADGEIAAQVVLHLGAGVVRGSSSSTGARALRDCYEAVARNGVSLLFPADGPRGPLHELKPGALMVARLTGAPILPVGYRASRAWRLRSWDRFIVPKPFARIEIYVGEPYYVPKDAALEHLERYRAEVQSVMRSLVPEHVD